MSDTATTNTTTAAKGANRAAKNIIDAVAAASDSVSPTVVETTETVLALDVPSKVIVNQRLIVAVTAVAAAGIGVAGVLGFQKIREVRARKAVEKKMHAHGEMTSDDILEKKKRDEHGQN